jgi:hypothetical protein
VCDQETSNEEAKARYWGYEIYNQRVVKPRKQTNKKLLNLGQLQTDQLSLYSLSNVFATLCNVLFVLSGSAKTRLSYNDVISC